MINKDNCVLLGTLAKPHGTKGLLQLWFGNLKAEDIHEKGLIFVEIDGLPVPFFIENFLEKTETMAILKIEGIDSEKKAREFSGYPVYIMKDQLKRKSAHIKDLQNLSGYRVIDLHLGFIGFAVEITNVATNPLLVVKNDDKEFLIPAHEDIIRDFNDREKIIHIDAPDGLFDL